VRNLAFSIAILICFYCLVGDASHGQEKPTAAPAIFIVAVKGEYLGDRPFTIVVDGRALEMPVSPNPRDKIILTKLADDPEARKGAEKEFKNSRAFRVVDSLESADFVFHLSSLYLDMLVPGYYWDSLVSNNRIAPNDARLATQAAVVSAETLRRRQNDYPELLREAVWRADTLTPGREPGNKNDWPKNLVKLFLKELKEDPALTAKLAAQPKLRLASGSDVVERTRPVVAGGRENDAPPASRSGALPRANDESPLRIETTLVLTPVSVMDKDGKLVTGLTAREFQLFEDGAPQEIADFGSEEIPLRVTLLLDVSGSTRFSIDNIQDSALKFVDQLRQQDQVMVVSFEGHVVVNTEFTNSRDQLMRAILSAHTGVGTRFYDALYLTLTERLNKVQGRKAILLFTDGVDNMSKFANWKTVIASYEEAGTIVYPVRYDTSRDLYASFMPRAKPGAIPLPKKVMKDYETAANQLKELAMRTGGRYHEVENISDTKQAFASIAEELRRQYWLGYYPTNTARDGRYRKIRVTVDRPDVVIRARDGYRAPSGESRQ
jgi:Ca-activated chloride channel family protein